MNLLTELYKICTKSGEEAEMKAFVKSCLSDLSLQIVEDEIGNLFITKGVADTYACISAHLDEVHLPCERTILVEDDKVYAVDENNNQVGCGADDKNGIWTIINLLHECPILKVALFVEEEKVGEIARRLSTFLLCEGKVGRMQMKVPTFILWGEKVGRMSVYTLPDYWRSLIFW